MYSSHWCVQHECYHHMDFTKLDSIAECTRNLAQRKVRQKKRKETPKHDIDCSRMRTRKALYVRDRGKPARQIQHSISPNEHWCFAAILLPIRLFYFVLFFCVSFVPLWPHWCFTFHLFTTFSSQQKKTKTKTNDKKNSIECERHALHSSSTVKYFRCVFVFHK